MVRNILFIVLLLAVATVNGQQECGFDNITDTCDYNPPWKNNPDILYKYADSINSLKKEKTGRSLHFI